MAKKKAKAEKKGTVKIGGAGTVIKLDVGDMRDKTKDIEVTIGVTTVAEALGKAGYPIHATRSAKQEGWRLNGKPCDWSDVVTSTLTDDGKRIATLWRLPEVKAGLVG